MTFYPETGPWSQEDFTVPTGIILDTYQTVTGGFFALKPNVFGSSNFIKRWSNISSWSFTNNLNTVNIISGAFLRLSGAAVTGQKVPEGYAGYQSLVTEAGAYKIETPVPLYLDTVEYFGYSGQTRQCFMLGQDSPNKSWFNSFSAGNLEATIEFDVASTQDIYNGEVSIGFNADQSLLTELPPIRRPYIGHGIYIDNGQYWDYLEINPFGIRSINHPEFGLPIDLTNPKRIRLGINAQNIILTTENGRGVIGRSVLNTVVQTGLDAKIIFGAPPISGVRNRFPFHYYGISGVAGTTLWDNIKILYGSSQLTANTGLVNYYTTTGQIGYTNTYDPGIPVTNWNNALIGFIPSNGSSTTTVVLQFSGVTGWADGPAAILSTQSSPQTLDLSTVPVFYNSRTASTHGKIENPIRFKIVQQSDGEVPPPPVDYISFSASTEQSILDLTPNWRSVNVPIVSVATIRETAFDSTIASPNRFSTFVLNSPAQTGLAANSLLTTEDSLFTGKVYVQGVVDITQAGNNSTAIRSFTTTGLKARQDSNAARVLGGDYVDNCFHNTMLDGIYYDTSQDENYIERRVFGELANGLQLPSFYIGRSVVTFGKKEVFRTIEQANRSRTNFYQKASSQQLTSFVQSVSVPAQRGLNLDSSVDYHDYTCGFEAVVESGISSGKFIYSLDLQVERGSQLYIYATGNNVSGNPGYVINGNDYRSFRTVSLPVATQNNSGEVYLGIVVNSGVTGVEEIAYNVDNIKFIPYVPGWVYSTGIGSYFHQSGLLKDSYEGISTVPAVRSATCLGFDLYLHGYPTGNDSILFQKTRDVDEKGFRLYCTNEGYLAVDVDTEAQSWAYDSSALNPFTGSVISTGLISDFRLPIGRWLNIGLVHQADTYNKLGYVNYSGAVAPANFASTNRLYLLADGYPVGAMDLMSNWNNGSQVLQGDKSPYLSYICDGSGTIKVASGILADVDAVQLSKPVVADAEIDYSIKIAKSSTPYFVPEVYLKPTAGGDIQNYLIDSSLEYRVGNDFFLGSIYNFDNPGHTNWDHGPWKNHLIYYGKVLKAKNSPYDPTGRYGFTTTYIPAGSYAIAKYSSAMDRQFNNYTNLQQTNLGISGLYQTGAVGFNSLKIVGWVYPFESGRDFFHIYEDEETLTGRRFSIGYAQNMRLRAHLASGNKDIWAVTGSVKHTLSGWNWIGVYARLGDYTGHGTTGTNSLVFVSNRGQDVVSLENIKGINYGFQYYGRSGSPSKSCIVFGGTGTFAYSDFAISPWHTGDVTYSDNNLIKLEIYRGKSGRYTVPMQNSSEFMGDYTISGFKTMSLTISGKTLPREDMIWVAAHNSYDSTCRLNGGIHLFDDEPFRQTESYYLNYDTSSVQDIVGNNYSPIKIGNQVPKGAVNLARISSPNYNTEASISNIDLAGYNISNLLAYKGGEYVVERGKGALDKYNATGSYRRINTGMFTGRADIEMSGQIYSDNIYVTPMSITSIESNLAYPAYLYYLVGRGRYGVRVPDAAGHPNIFYSGFTTGSVVSEYMDNIQKIKNSISIKNSAGQPLSFDEYPFDIITSPHTPEDLYGAVQSGLNININGITRFDAVNTYVKDKLPTGVFSVVLILNDTYRVMNDSAWIHYPAYDFESKTEIPNKSEIINPSPIMRRNLDNEVSLPGRFSTSLDAKSLLYTLKVFGVDGEYTGKF